VVFAAPIAAPPSPPVPPVVAAEPAPAAEEVPQTPEEVLPYYEKNEVPGYFKDGDADADINDEEEGSDVETVDTTDAGSGIVMDLDPAEYERPENPDVECGKPSATAVARAQYIPDNWTPVIDLTKGQPEVLAEEMNPAGWNDFTFRPVFEKKTSKAKATTYVRHELMGGVQVVPLNASGERDAGTPKGLSKEYLHLAKVDAKAPRAKATRMCEPITFSKHVPAAGDMKAFELTHHSFMSTGPTNLSGVHSHTACHF
jgi:hypothetical protein